HARLLRGAALVPVGNQEPEEAREEGDRDECERQAEARLENELVREVLVRTEKHDRDAEAEREEGCLHRIARRAQETNRPVLSSCHCAHTFSTSGLPSSPEGMKMSVMARMQKTATSL